MRILLVLLTGCALVSRSPPLEVRYFSPEPTVAVDARPDERVVWPDGQRPRVRLGRIAPSAHLRQRIVQRASPVEIALYQSRLWTEVPDVYVRRSLERALFEQRGLEQAISGPAITLDVEVLAFEEVRTPHAGRVQLAYRVRDDRMVLDSGIITAERDVPGAGFGAVVAAISAALSEASARVADRVMRQVTPLRRRSGEP